MRAVLSFLTRIPAKSGRIEDAAKQQYLFPVVGLIIGAVVYFVYVGTRVLFPAEVGTLLAVFSLYLVTGLVHLDGLSDFSDGIMASGSNQEKISAMKDVKVGVGGIFSTVFILLSLFFVLSNLETVESGNAAGVIPLYGWGCALMVAEVSAKLSMNTCMVLGRALPGGVGALFMEHATRLQYGRAVALSTVIGVVLAQSAFMVVYTGVVIALVVVGVAHRNFGGVNGDVIGASNEISRVAALLVWMVVH